MNPSVAPVLRAIALCRRVSQALEDENERLLTERRAAEAKRASEAPEEARLSEENAEREATVRELWNKQTA
eukprot:1633286-Pleurochrysis_carterae.AAC.13